MTHNFYPVHPMNYAHILHSVDIYVQVDFIHILHDYFTGTEAITWLPQCQWNNREKERDKLISWACFLIMAGQVLSQGEKTFHKERLHLMADNFSAIDTKQAQELIIINTTKESIIKPCANSVAYTALWDPWKFT